jgi:hypothetical protein
MVAHELRIIVEKVSVSSQEVVKRDTVKIYDIINPENILDLGLRHGEQISLLEKIQNALGSVTNRTSISDLKYILKVGFCKNSFYFSSIDS